MEFVNFCRAKNPSPLILEPQFQCFTERNHPIWRSQEGENKNKRNRQTGSCHFCQDKKHRLKFSGGDCWSFCGHGGQNGEKISFRNGDSSDIIDFAFR